MREMSPLDFALHLAVLGAEMAHGDHEGLEEAALIIEHEAKASAGTYQPQSGPFAEWPELAQSTKDDRAAQGYPENEPELRSGRMVATIEHTVGAHEAEVGSDDEILEYQELGTVNMPPRSILGGAAARKSDEVAALLGGRFIAALVGPEVFEGRLKIR